MPNFQKKICLYTAAVCVSILAHHPVRAECQIEINNQLGITGYFKTAKIFQASPVFWKAPWEWVSPGLKEDPKKGSVRRYSSRNSKAPFSWKASVMQQPQKLVIDTQLTVKQPVKLRGAYAFKMRGNDGQITKTQLAKTRDEARIYLPGTQQAVTVTFDPPLKRLSYERGNPQEFRAGFIAPDEIAEDSSQKISIALPSGCRIRKPIAEKLQAQDKSGWLPSLMDAQSAPVDLSFLNAADVPAGKRGRVERRGDRLVFKDNTTARFWGTNITANALFRTPKKEIQNQAKRLSKLGFNLVRLHHHDSPWVNPNIFGDRNKRESTRALDPVALDAIDHWIAALKAEGIYIWLDIHVERPHALGDDIADFDELKKTKQSESTAKGYMYVNESMQARWREFTRQYLEHVNGQTGLAYKDDPAIIAVLLTNENDLTHHFGNALLQDKNVPAHTKRYLAKSKAFAQRHGLNANETWRSWQFGPSKLLLSDLEREFNQMAIGHVRSLGYRGLIATTNSWGGMSLAGHPSLTIGDLIDVHSYDNSDFLNADPRAKSNSIHWISAGQVHDYPLSVTEWNISPFPAYDRSALPLFVAGMGAFQQWDALMQYAYTQRPANRVGRPDNWQLINDTAMLAQMPAAALLYRRGDAAPAKQTYVFAPSQEDMFYNKITPATSAALRTLPEQHGLRIAMPKTPSLPWLQPSIPRPGEVVFSNASRSFLSKTATQITSDTREISRDWQQGHLTIDTDRTQSFAGWIGGIRRSTQDVTFNVETPFASTSVQSLGSKPIRDSDEILISLAAQAGQSPVNRLWLSQPVEGEIIITAPPGLTLYSLSKTGRRKSLKTPYQDGRYEIDLAARKTWWYILAP